MKPFIFNEQEYTDLNALGLAFVEQYDLALQCIKEKPWLKFFKQFKQHKKKIKHIFYQSRYLQSALSMIIYWITEEHILTIGHQRYPDIASCLKDIRRNPALYYFVEDHGFSLTLLETLEDERLKADIKALEDNYTDEFSFLYMESYFSNDSLEDNLPQIQAIASAKDPFLASLDTFTKEENQLTLARSYSLHEVLELRKQKCPIFYGLSLVQDRIDAIPILTTAFYHILYEKYKSFKFKGKPAKKLKKDIKLLNKKTKKTAKLSVKAKIDLEEKLYLTYLDWINLYYLDKIIIKEEALKPIVPYCHTFVPISLQEERHFEQEVRIEEYHPVEQKSYDLNKFYFSLKTHRNFALWSIVILLISFANYFVFVFMDSLRKSIFDFLEKTFNSSAILPDAIASKTNLFYFIGVGVVFLVSMFIFVLRIIEKKKYKKLCRLAYYRKHELKLKEAELQEFEVLKEKEASYVKQIDHYYRFYGGISMAGLSLCTVLSTLGLAYAVTPFFVEEYTTKIYTLIFTKPYFLVIGPAVCLGLSFLRHKKTAWTVIFTTLLSLIASVGILFLV